MKYKSSRVILKYFLLFILYFVSQGNLLAQVTGTVTSTDQNVTLPFASVYISNSTIGTTTNSEGLYKLELDPGSYTLVFRFVGFKAKEIEVTFLEEVLHLDVALDPEEVSLEEIVIRDSGEDPAYQIIREAIAVREKNKNAFDHYQADVYIKGQIKVKDAPEYFLGMEMGSMDGILDSNRQGITYLSESQSKIYFKQPDQRKEVMYASKVSGDANGISFNQLSDANFDFYEEYIHFGRNLVGPLCNKAFDFYRFKLISASLNNKGHLINKIEVVPKVSSDPVFFGHIYIVEDTWNIANTNLSFEGKSTKVGLFDTISVRQIFVPLKEQDFWPMYSMVLDFGMDVFAFSFAGNFSYVLSNYDFETPIDKNIFNDEIFKIEENANEKDSSYWEEIRPLPLTRAETKDYVKKDSLEILWNSESYLDSIDRKSNKFGLLNLIFGYTFSDSFKKRAYKLESTLSTIRFNPIQGYILALDTEFVQWGDKYQSYFTVTPRVSYGFKDKKLRAYLKIKHRLNSIENTSYSIQGGRITSQLNEEGAATAFGNTYDCLLKKQNNAKLFSKDFLQGRFKREMFNGWTASFDLEYAQRDPLVNLTQHSLLKRDRNYPNNNPICVQCRPITSHKSLKFETLIRWRPGQKYMSMDKFRLRKRSKWPDLLLKYKKGLPTLGGETDYDFLSFGIHDNRLDLRLWGFLEYKIELGGFLRNKKTQFIDYYHFASNYSTLWLDPHHLNSYKLIDYYKYSGTSFYQSIRFQHHFEGKIIDNIPMLRDWGITSVMGFAGSRMGEAKFAELNIGIERIPFAGLPLFRLDYIISIENRLNGNGYGYTGQGAVLSMIKTLTL